MSYKFQKIYTLIAQTPLIHFQHDQSGATLRATEVKPKLDKYLLKCAKEENINNEVLSSWLIKDNLGGNEAEEQKNDRKSFHYKMKIQKKDTPEDSEILLDDCKFYFGNQGNAEKKDIVFSNCELEITCFIPDLLNFLHKHIFDFFVLHNFGTRQTKGFGGFLLQYQNDDGSALEQEESEIQSKIDDVFKNSKQPHFYAEMPQSDKNSIKNRMNHALTVYSIMKNGLNATRYDENNHRYRFRNRYIKGWTMRPYLDTQSKRLRMIGSDKAFIKSKIHHPNPVDDQEKENLDRDYPQYTFIRALLGLAENYEFRDRYRNNGSTTTQKNGRTIINYTPVGVSVISCPSNSDGTPKIDPNTGVETVKKSAEIQRFASPVTIKIFNHRIYFLFNDSYKQMLDRTFLFLSFRKVRVERQRNGRIIYENETHYESIQNCLNQKHYISTPKTFDIEAFIDNFISYYNNNAQAKLQYFVESNPNFENPHANSRNITLKKGGESNGTSNKNGK